jgi:phosphoribosyl-ATP pyrophosphohydrolase/phosphoribosyl-AMP cyclohydrolase
MNGKIDWQKSGGLIPAVVQDAATGRVLMLAYMNEESLALTEKTRRVTFFSRSRQSLWIKGETSGNHLDFLSAQADCDGDTILIQARPHGPVCHTGNETCFAGDPANADLGFLTKLTQIIESRFDSPDPQKSYVAKLIADGPDRMAQKVGEEAVETVIASKNEDQGAFEGEAADLLFHLMVLLRAKGSSLTNLVKILEKRHR